jgi:hypothetical protein
MLSSLTRRVKGETVNNKDTSSRHTKKIELIAAITMGVLAIAIFVLQVFSLSQKTTRIETALFSTLEFLLTIGFTWFSTRAISRGEFEDSLKRFAISAYRRIADIERMIKRLQGEVNDMVSECSADEAHNLKLVGAIVADATQVVRSSIADWADVIGDELLTLEKIKRLEQDKEELSSKGDSETSDSIAIKPTLDEINDQISRLISSLPTLLQIETISKSTISRRREHAAYWMASLHKEQRGVRLTAVTGDDYKHDRDFKTLEVGEILHTVITETGAFDVADTAGAILGRLQNNSPLDYYEFTDALEMCYGTQALQLEVVELDKEEIRNDKLYGWFSLKVISEPVYTRPKRKPKKIAAKPKE